MNWPLVLQKDDTISQKWVCKGLLNYPPFPKAVPMNATGPTLLKGGPGTGKSTIALYRVRALVQELRKQGHDKVHILFTTYTHALIKSSEQLLQQLLGPQAHVVEVQTADKIAMQLLGQAGVALKILDDKETRDVLQRSIKHAQFDGTLQQKQAQRQFIEQLSLDYLQQELDQVIVARQIYTLKEYLEAERTGRKVRFNALQRRAVWSVHETLQHLLRQQNKLTWRQARAMAEAYVTQGAARLLYDAVVIDEAQDLDPSALRLLVQLCKQPNRIFITADANQSIYGSGFNWADVHEDLRFRGRTAVLHANYRSTREIGEAAQAYLAGGALDSEPVERVYVNSGPPPVMRVVQNNVDQVQLLMNYFRQAQSAFRLGIGSCAILCPTVNAGKALAEELKARGIEATFMAGHELDLARPGVKVLTLKSSKGLEFPIVALAGFVNGAWRAAIPARAAGDEREEFLALERRTMFVGMTRAMRALLVALPERAQSPLFSGFEGDYWNSGA